MAMKENVKCGGKKKRNEQVHLPKRAITHPEMMNTSARKHALQASQKHRLDTVPFSSRTDWLLPHFAISMFNLVDEQANRSFRLLLNEVQSTWLDMLAAFSARSAKLRQGNQFMLTFYGNYLIAIFFFKYFICRFTLNYYELYVYLYIYYVVIDSHFLLNIIRHWNVDC